MVASDTLLQNRYLIRNQIGRGSMGAIYQATDLRLDTDVAVKQIVRRGRQMRQAFAQEARLLARLRHPALPKVIDHFSDEAGHFLVMEFIPGDNLALAALKRLEPFAVERVLDWGQQLLRLLAYLHGCQPPIVHGDIKPQNLKLNERAEIVLLDFGLAQQETAWLEPEDSIRGYSSHYAPPEQMRGRGTDARSDLYALAATLYDLATGVKPPDAVRHRLAALAAGQPDPLQPAHEVEPSVPALVSDVWQRALALDPEERYASARDMHLALETAVAQQTAVPHNLPAQMTPFVGRRREMGAARQRFLAEGVRLLTLTGPGGVGKTRLGLQIAATLRDKFVDGVFLVPLAPLRDTDLVLSTLAHSLGVKESGRKSLQEAVQEWLRDKQVLLLLDNFEHVLDAALLVTELLATSPQLKVLVTSREVLHVRGEHEFPVPPLELPDLGRRPTAADALRYAAVQLFVQRARAAEPGFALDDENVTVVAEICLRLDGLPLAIELAAARIKTLAPVQILDRLAHRFDLLRGGPRDLPARQQALQATLDWSHELLVAAEKVLFRRLAVFAGGWTVAAAEAVCQPNADDGLEALPLAIAEGLASLADKSLVQRPAGVGGEPRYTMLVTVQAYAAERLAESGESQALRNQHAAHYLAWAEQLRPQLLGATPELPLTRLELEHDNLRAVLQWALGNNVEAGYRLGDALWRFWQAHNHHTEGRSWLDKLLAKNDTVTINRVKALSASGNLAFDQGDFHRSIALHEESLTLCRQLGDQFWESIGLNNLAVGWLSLGNYDQAMRYLEEGLTLAREVGHTTNVGHTLNNLGVLSLRQGDYQQARRYLEESLSTFRKQADKRAICLPLGNLGEVAGYQGEYKQAVDLLQEAVRLSEELGDKWLIAQNLHSLGLVARDQGHIEPAMSHVQKALNLLTEIENLEGRSSLLNLLAKVALDSGDETGAVTLSKESLALCRQLNNKEGTGAAWQNLATIAWRQGDYDYAAERYRQALALFSELKHRLDVVVCLEGLAAVANSQDQAEQAAYLLGAADALRAAMGAPLPPADRPNYERLLKAVQATLDEEAFAAAWAEGQTTSLKTAVAYALEV
jgi:predicted ATPase